MKIDRLLGILSVLLQQDKVTAPYLAEKFEVSRRTINRDIENLCKAGIPIVTAQGKNGGISVMEGYKMDKTLLTSSEMQAILSGLRGLDSVSGSNRYQLLMEKLAVGSMDIVPFNHHILINLSSWYKTTLAPKIELIQGAIERKKQISFCYYSPSGERERCIEPYYLLFEWSSWYVWGYCLLREEFRLFKLNRLDGLKCLETSVGEREVIACPFEQKTVFETREVLAAVLFEPVMKWRLVEEFDLQRFQETEDGRLRIDISWSDKESFFSWLLPFRDYAEILEPPEIREEFITLLHSIIRRNSS